MLVRMSFLPIEEQGLVRNRLDARWPCTVQLLFGFYWVSCGVFKVWQVVETRLSLLMVGSTSVSPSATPSRWMGRKMHFTSHRVWNYHSTSYIHTGLSDDDHDTPWINLNDSMRGCRTESFWNGWTLKLNGYVIKAHAIIGVSSFRVEYIDQRWGCKANNFTNNTGIHRLGLSH